jgi:hypothetical protein
MCTLHNKPTFRISQCINQRRHVSIHVKKKSVVKPIYKKWPKEDANNNCPITLVPALSKILEKVLQNQLISYLDKHNILNKSQFEFRKNKSNKDAIATVIKNVF